LMCCQILQRWRCISRSQDPELWSRVCAVKSYITTSSIVLFKV
jgi:hypothetical protein